MGSEEEGVAQHCASAVIGEQIEENESLVKVKALEANRSVRALSSEILIAHLPLNDIRNNIIVLKSTTQPAAFCASYLFVPGQVFCT